MQGRSWMACGMLAVGSWLALVSTTPAADPAPGRAASNKLLLQIRVAGIGTSGCDLEIKPAHAGCSFKPIKMHVARGVKVEIPAFEVKSSSADRDCTVAITVSEPGQAPRTIRRGLRLAAPQPGKPAPVQTLVCYLSSPSMAAKVEAERKVR